jgi:hypothetical protein
MVLGLALRIAVSDGEILLDRDFQNHLPGGDCTPIRGGVGF